MTTNQKAGIIADMQRRALEKGAEIEALTAEVRTLRDAIEKRDAARARCEMLLDEQLREFKNATLRYHLRTWLRKIW